MVQGYKTCECLEGAAGGIVLGTTIGAGFGAYGAMLGAAVSSTVGGAVGGFSGAVAARVFLDRASAWYQHNQLESFEENYYNDD